jgi:hypothetical protein
LFDGEASLAKYVGESSFSQSMVLRYNGAEVFLRRSFFEGYVAALLAQFDESGALEGADKALPGDTRQLRHLSGDFYNCPEWLLLGSAFLWAAPSLQVKLDRFPEIRPRGLDVFALGSHIEFRAARDIQVALFGDQGGEAVSHIQMLMEASRGSKQGSPTEQLESEEIPTRRWAQQLKPEGRIDGGRT